MTSLLHLLDAQQGLPLATAPAALEVKLQNAHDDDPESAHPGTVCHKSKQQCSPCDAKGEIPKMG
jgi:hypothetical protein